MHDKIESLLSPTAKFTRHENTFCFFLDSDRPLWSMALERSYSEFGGSLDMRRNFQKRREEANGCNILRKFFDFVTEPGGVMIDLASGPSGYFAPALDRLKSDAILIAADACPTVLSALADASANERFFLFDLDLDQPLPLRDASVDVFSGNLLCNVNRYPDLLREVFRCLKPGGRLAVMESFFEEGSATAEFLTQRQAIFSSLETYVDFCESVGFEYLGGDLLRETTGKLDPGDLLPIAPEDRSLTRTVFFQK